MKTTETKVTRTECVNIELKFDNNWTATLRQDSANAHRRFMIAVNVHNENDGCPVHVYFSDQPEGIDALIAVLEEYRKTKAYTEYYTKDLINKIKEMDIDSALEQTPFDPINYNMTSSGEIVNTMTYRQKDI